MTQERRVRIQPHRLGMGWHHVWEYDSPIERLTHSEDGTQHYWRDTGESSEGCIMWLADNFVRAKLATTARDIYRLAYEQRDGEALDDDWLATDALRDAWAAYTVLPKRCTHVQVRKLFEDLEDVNYHSFLARLIELIEQRVPELAAKLDGWCHTSTASPANPPTSLTDPT